MNWLLSTPAAAFLCAIGVLIAGLVAGWHARNSCLDDAINSNEAGDTHAGLPPLPTPKRTKYFSPRSPAMRTANSRVIEQQVRDLQRRAFPPLGH